MPNQNYAADGSVLSGSVWVKQDILSLLKLNNLPKGLVGLNTKLGLAEVIQKEGKKAVFMKLGKLLNQQGLEEKQVRESSQILTELKILHTQEVSFAYTEEEILRVYQEGPSACMANCESVALYSNDYTAVAYLEVKGKILARTVICRDKEIGLSYNSLYGFGEPLAKMLEELGYTSGDLEGCYLPLRHDHLGRIMCPYIDGTNYITVEGDEISISSDGEYQADSTDGILVEHTCDECHETLLRDEVYYSEHSEQNLCEGCHEVHHVYIDGESYHKESDSVQELEDDSYVLSEDAEYLEYRNEWHLLEDCAYNNYDEVYILKEDLDL